MTAPNDAYLTPTAAARLAAVRDEGRIAEMSGIVPFERITTAINDIVEPTTYDYLPDAATSAFAEVERRFGPSGVGHYRKHLVVRLIDALPNRIETLNLPQAIRDLYPDTLDYVVKDISETPDEEYLRSRQGLVRELRLVSGRSIPCGARIVDNSTFLPKSIYRYRGWRDNLGCLLYIYGRMGGRAPVYRTHVETRYLKYFNEESWDKCYLNVALLMRQNRHIRGVVGTSWFYDPQLETISPWLTYLRKRQTDNGAYLHYDGHGDMHTERATTTSEKRRQLYEQGAYIPTCYTLIWARKELLRWADRQSTGLSKES